MALPRPPPFTGEGDHPQGGGGGPPPRLPNRNPPRAILPRMFPRRDPELLSQYLCRFCGERIKWGAILRLIRVDPDTPPYQLSESACHTECLRQVLRPEVALT